MSEVVVSVVMAVHNGETFLEEAVHSLLAQTFGRFELIIVDDGSTDQTPGVLHDLAQRDHRIRVMHNAKNLGLAASLNRGIDVARGEFIARLDADDIATTDRLERQVTCLQKDSQLVLVGSNVAMVTENGSPYGMSDLPLADWTIRCTALLRNPFAHPAVMMRAAPFRNNGIRYDERFDTTQDWDLWIRLFDYGAVKNLPEPLVQQRVHGGSVSVRKRERQLANSLCIQERYVRHFLDERFWSRERFRLLNEAFLGDRRQADQLGLDRVQACRIALNLLHAVSEKYPDAEIAQFESALVQRCVQMGLAPPLRAGWFKLARSLVACHAAMVAYAFLALLKRKITNIVSYSH